MKGLLRLLSAERVKIANIQIWLLVLLSPLIAVAIGFDVDLPSDIGEIWVMLQLEMGMGHGLLFLPILSGLFAAFICRYEHSGGGWKQLLVLPVSRSSVYMAKFTVIAVLLAVTQLLFLTCVILVGWMKGVVTPIPWEFMMRSSLGGWVACLPLVALQLAVSIMWNSFAAPLALNVVFTIPNMLVINSERIGPYYPWAQPLLSMLPNSQSFGAFNLPLANLMIVVLGSFIVFFIAGWVAFQLKEV